MRSPQLMNFGDEIHTYQFKTRPFPLKILHIDYEDDGSPKSNTADIGVCTLLESNYATIRDEYSTFKTEYLYNESREYV